MPTGRHGSHDPQQECDGNQVEPFSRELLGLTRGKEGSEHHHAGGDQRCPSRRSGPEARECQTDRIVGDRQASAVDNATQRVECSFRYGFGERWVCMDG